MRRPVALALMSVLLVGCGGAGGDSGADPAAALPAGAPVYLELVVNPEGDQKTRMTELAARVLGTEEPGEKLVELIEKASGERGTYERDIEPWLGERAGLALTGFDQEEPSFMIAVAAGDADAAAEAMEREAKREKSRRVVYKDADFYVDGDGEVTAVAGDYVLFAADEPTMKAAIDAQKGSALAAGERFKQALEPLPSDRVGTIYFDVKAVVEEAGEIGAAERQIFNLVLGGAPPTAIAVLAEEDHLAFESRIDTKQGGGLLGKLSGIGSLGSTELLGELPGDAWGAVGAPEVGRTAKQMLQTLSGPLGGAVLGAQLEKELGLSLERDVFSWLGDVGLFVRGGSLPELDGAAVIAVTDVAKARAAIPRLVGALQLSAGLETKPISLEGASLAFEVGAPAMPKPIVVALGEERAVIGYGADAAKAGLDPQSKLSDADVWDRAGEVLDGMEPSMVFDAPAVLKLVGQAAAGDPGFAEAKPYLDSLEVIAAGSDQDGDALRSRFAAGVGD